MGQFSTAKNLAYWNEGLFTRMGDYLSLNGGPYSFRETEK